MSNMTHGAVASTFKDFDYDTCILGLHNGTLPDGRRGNGSYTQFGIYAPTSTEKRACQDAHDGYYTSPKYGLFTIYFICTTLAVFALLNLLNQWDRSRRLRGKSPLFLLLPILRTRFRRWTQTRRKVLGIRTPPLGVCLLLLSFFVFSNIMVWGVRPYYRPPNWGSPPLGLRSEWVATAIIPFIFALATKRNFIQIVTALPYRTLMIVHQWGGQICLFFSLVHTIAMILRVTPMEPWWYTMQHRTTYWTGFAALSQLLALCLLSLRPIRQFMYETFYWLHMFTAFGFVAFMFPHCLDGWVLPKTGPVSMLNSWAYLYATVALWFSAIFWRVGAIAYQTRCFTGISRASLKILSDDALKITVPYSMSYTAGQHFFLRFPTIEPFGSHPFTVASLPRSKDASGGATGDVEFVLRPGKGITSRLFRIASKATINRLPVVLDGPYGGEHLERLKACDAVVLIAGGTGITAVAPVAASLVRHSSATATTVGAEEEGSCGVPPKIVVVWAVRRSSSLSWFEAELRTLRAGYPGEITVTMHVTSPSETEKKNVLECDSSSASNDNLVEKGITNAFAIEQGRPAVGDIILTEAASTSGRLAVLVCGPESLCDDVRSAVVLQQQLILLEMTALQECELCV
ncbi:hypothetical protein T439DRAFT_357804 [Meredithblackwellia eburnea MCA 4105]